jgi:hypothetical protein
MSLLDNASLLLTPNAYKEGKLYSVIPSDGSGDFTFTRATTATRVNSDGLVELVPYNLLQYSEEFDNAAWGKARTTIDANVITAPDGTLTADKLVEDINTGEHNVRVDYSNNVIGSYVASIYAKAAERTNLQFVTTGSVGNSRINFDLLSGIVSAQGFGATGSITNVGDGWYRCIVELNATAQSFVRNQWNLITSPTSARVEYYTGDGTSGLFIWGAQFVEGTSARDYLRTETRLNIPRLDYSLGGCPNILLEPQRTNLVNFLMRQVG